ncbi:MAG: hypothetical protein JWR52_3490 [Marmoricola sp.]|nr:hypothetical protein [Marmoricola sp.]
MSRFSERRDARREAAGAAEVDDDQPEGLETYKVTYRGGLAHLPKPKVGGIMLTITPDAFRFEPTRSAQGFWQRFTIPYADVTDVAVVERQVNTFEAIAGGLNSRQLNQDNNIHFSYVDADGNETLLRVEMLTGVTVQGQARKCQEFEDRLRVHQVRSKFRAAAPAGGGAASTDVAEQLSKLADMKASGALSEDEFVAAKARLLG